MRTFNLAAIGAALVLPRLANGFMSPTACVMHRSRSLHSAVTTKMQAGGGKPMSYSDRLKQARAAKAAAAGGAGSGAGQQVSNSPARAMPPAAPPAKRPTSPRGEPIMDEPESPFSPPVYEEIRTAITILAARLQREKPLSRDEFERFEAAVAIIVEDALPRQELPTNKGKAQVTDAVVAAPAHAAVSNAVRYPARKTGDEIENEGPAWDPASGGYGLPSNTQNTYVIEGMGAMTPHEYQEALRQRVSARARSARDSGSYGNIVSNDYLRFLNKNPKSDDAQALKEQENKKGHEDFRNYK